MAKTRFLALDVMRGLTLALMVLVNTPGSWNAVYAPLLHADWHGATPTDYVFPFFLFIVGAALFFSSRRPVPMATQWIKIVRRSALIFIIGVLLNAFPFTAPLDELRVFGVLQRIALAYLFAAPIALFLKGPARWVLMVAILFGYWALLQLGSDPYGLTGSLVRAVDLWLVGPDHLWQGKGVAFDPEGFLSTLPAIVSVLLGFEATRILCTVEPRRKALAILAVSGVLLILAGLLWHPFFPVNKYLWTSSFVLLTGGAAIVCLLVLVWLEPVTLLRPMYRAFQILGQNPLFIYVLSIVWAHVLYLIPVGDQSAYQWTFELFDQVLSPKIASLLFALLNVAIMWAVAWYLHRKRIIISI
ncbi:acyltransferase family protein [Marinimicrobium sp. ABcell2]|uniref:acyltransferase family protein n=1 Tax=Marinimicrobium sp. ABcell2 TaxID=3069751 RepID=UPI0027AE7E28|nr:heparan-alpha-glucosaminide N-acetyltransferase domain-containing protein [Marinimicrobium sp. ABcell2]MDQ2075922.1 heparan-alpha-glucosaminide N-acetyltransferase domain-containing protein [Marinimicrobium sp. ABcell2]